MIRFFVTSQELSGPSHTLTGENAKHAKVLRLKAGEEVLLCDGAGQECLCTVADPESLTLTLGECRPSASEAKVRASVYMAFPKADKLEHVIQKATELGARRSWPSPPPGASPGRMRRASARSWSAGRKSPPPLPSSPAEG